MRWGWVSAVGIGGGVTVGDCPGRGRGDGLSVYVPLPTPPGILGTPGVWGGAGLALGTGLPGGVAVAWASVAWPPSTSLGRNAARSSAR